MAKHLKKAVADATENVVQQLEAARDKIGDLTSALADMTERRDSAREDRQVWVDQAHKNHAIAEDWKKRAEELEGRFGDLRQKHLDVKLALAEREGYIARVNEQEGRPAPKTGQVTLADHAHHTDGTTPVPGLDRVRRYAAESDYLRNKHWVY